MKPYGIQKRKKVGPCGPHDLFECFCDSIHKSKERADTRKAIKREIDERAAQDSL